MQLGSSLEDHWGLDTLVRVGETWLPRMLAASTSDATSTHRASTASEGHAAAAAAPQPAAADVPLLKLFEFLTASMCLYVIEEKPGGRAPVGVWAEEGGEEAQGDR